MKKITLCFTTLVVAISAMFSFVACVGKMPEEESPDDSGKVEEKLPDDSEKTEKKPPIEFDETEKEPPTTVEKGVKELLGDILTATSLTVLDEDMHPYFLYSESVVYWQYIPGVEFYFTKSGDEIWAYDWNGEWVKALISDEAYEMYTSGFGISEHTGDILQTMLDSFDTVMVATPEGYSAIGADYKIRSEGGSFYFYDGYDTYCFTNINNTKVVLPDFVKNAKEGKVYLP